MGWKITFPDGPTVLVDDLTPDTFEALAKAEDASWYSVYQSPALTPARLQRLLVACAEHAGIDPPEPPATMRDFHDRFENWLEPTEPIDEEPMTDGFPPTPGELEDGSTSTSPGATDGPPTLSADSPSTSS